MLCAAQIKEKLSQIKISYADINKPGIARLRCGRGYRYIDQKGDLITNSAVLKRIKKLAIPPAYSQVWISPSQKGHIQAVGKDERGRKQYIYHPQWEILRNENRYKHLRIFGESLPTIRRKINCDLNNPSLSKLRLIAVVIKLLDITHIRVGNRQYAKENKSHGLTTLQKKHIEVKGNKIHFDFRGKSKQQWHLAIKDEQLAKIIKKCTNIPGQDLFKYYNDKGQIKILRSNDINEYLNNIIDIHITAKDFRTWASTVLFIEAVLQSNGNEMTNAKAACNQIIKQIAKELGHTVAVCKKSYLHPSLPKLHVEGSLAKIIKSAVPRRNRYFTRSEEITLHFLKSHDIRAHGIIP